MAQFAMYANKSAYIVKITMYAPPRDRLNKVMLEQARSPCDALL